MAARRSTFRMDHPIIILFVMIAVVASMSLAAEVLKPLALAILLSFALAPLCRLLERRGIPRTASVVLTVVLALGALAASGYVVGKQLNSLAADLPKSKDNILRKLGNIQPSGSGALSKAAEVLQDVEKQVDAAPKKDSKVLDVNVVSRPDFRNRLMDAVGPYLEFLGVGSFVLILVLFMLMGREDLGDRITQMFGRKSLTLTTRTMEEVGHRISRYLAMFVLVNSSYGLIIGIGLAIIGVPYAVLWGFLAAALRFIPYVGPASAFALPLLFSIATAPGWTQPLMVLALFGVLEVLANSFLEPVIYGRTTGVSALGLLVAAMFWTWLWGMLGLLLSTPLTVCLAVLGKYVPSLSIFSTLLGEESELPQDVRYYQRLLAMDQDGATEIVDAASKEMPRAQVFDQVLVPALSQAERDYTRDEIDDREQAFIWRVTRDIIEELSNTPDMSLKAANPGISADSPAVGNVRVVGIATNDRGDVLTLRMLAQLLERSGVELELVTHVDSPLKLADSLSQDRPALVVLSHLPPIGLTSARYLVRRLRAAMSDLPIFVGRWGERGDTQAVAEKLSTAGASRVAFSLAEACDQIVEAVSPAKDNAQVKGLAAIVK